MASDISSRTRSASSILRAMRSVLVPVDPLQPLVAHRVEPRRRQGARRPRSHRSRWRRAGPRLRHRPEARCPAPWRPTRTSFARDGGAAGDLALVERVLGPDPVARQPRAEKTAPRPRPVPRPVRSPAGRKTAVAPSANHRQHERACWIFAPWRNRRAALEAWHFQPFRRQPSRAGVSPGRRPVGLCCPPYRFAMAQSTPNPPKADARMITLRAKKRHTLQKSLNSYHPRGSPRSFSGHDRRVRFQKPDEAVPGERNLACRFPYTCDRPGQACNRQPCFRAGKSAPALPGDARAERRRQVPGEPRVVGVEHPAVDREKPRAHVARPVTDARCGRRGACGPCPAAPCVSPRRRWRGRCRLADGRAPPKADGRRGRTARPPAGTSGRRPRSRRW